METIWFTLVALMLTVYVVLDGFDFGAGILHLLVAKTDAKRRTVLAAGHPRPIITPTRAAAGAAPVE